MPRAAQARRRARAPDDRRPRGVRRARAPARPRRCWCRSAARCARRSACRGARTPASARCRSSTTAPRRRSSAICRSSPPASGSPPTRSPSRSRAATRWRAHDARVLEPDGAHYRLTGTKQFITNAGFADLFTVFAKVDGEHVHGVPRRARHAGLSLGPGGAQARHPRLVDAPAHPRGRRRCPPIACSARSGRATRSRSTS